MFDGAVKTSIEVGLVGGEGFAVDASLIAADANKQRSIAGQDWRRDPSRAVKEYLATFEDRAWGAATEVVPKFVDELFMLHERLSATLTEKTRRKFLLIGGGGPT